MAKRAMAIVGGEQCLAGLQFVLVSHLQFFKREERARTLEGVRQTLGGDDGLDVAVLWIEPVQEVQHLAGFGDGLADVADFVSGTLEGGAVLVDRGVALDGGAEFGLNVDGAVQLIVEEEALDIGPQGECRDPVR